MSYISAQFEDALDKIELGLEAVEKLLAVSNGMSKVIQNFNVFEDVENPYNYEGHQIVKDFIKVGLEFVRDHPGCFTKHPDFSVKAKEGVADAKSEVAESKLDSLISSHQQPQSET
jgi:hypothetical protein